MAATVCALLPSVLARGVPEPRDEAPDAPVAPHVAVPRAALLAPLDVAELEAELLEALVAPDVVPRRAEVPDASAEPGVLGQSVPVRDGLAAPRAAGGPAELEAPDVLPRRAEAPDGLAAPGEVELSERVLDGPAVSFEGFVRVPALALPPFSSQRRADAQPE